MNTALEGLQRLPKFSVDGIASRRIYEAFLDPKVQEALDILRKAAELSVLPREVTSNTWAMCPSL
jgi:hypothetical protein